MREYVIKVETKEKTCNPAPLGLFAFGITTFLLNFHNVGIYPMNTVILSMAIFFGGTAQVIAGIFEWIRGSAFSFLAFSSYGFFWISFAFLLVFPNISFGLAPDTEALAFYLLCWGIFSSVLLVATLKEAPLTLVFTFATLVPTFMLLAAHYWSGSHRCLLAAGYIGLVCAGSAVYNAAGFLLNELFGKTIVPLFERL